MPIRKLMRESVFNLARKDVAFFLADHEEDLLVIFREEMSDLDNRLPEEELFIDIKLVPLGETILRAALHAITRFLLAEDFPPSEGEKVRVSVKSEDKGDVLTVKESKS